MDLISVGVRKEVVQCLECNRPKDFIYLSDLLYGERLIFSENGMPCAFIRLMSDEIFDEYEKVVRRVLQDNFVVSSEDKTRNLIIQTFGVTCDKINGRNIDFSQDQKKCYYCGSTAFSKDMIEPESFIKIEVPLVSHEKWTSMVSISKYELVKNAIMPQIV